MILYTLIMNNYRHIFYNKVFKERIRVYATIVTIAAILIASTLLLTLDSFSLQLSKNDGNAFASSYSELTGTTSGGNAPKTDIFTVPPGYTIKPVVWNLTAPDTVTFDDKGNMYVGEAGYPFTNLPYVPRILKIDPTGNISVFVDTKLNSPIVDITFHNGLLFVSHMGKISTVDITNGTVKDIIVGLPENGDHYNNQIAFSPDG